MPVRIRSRDHKDNSSSPARTFFVSGGDTFFLRFWIDGFAGNLDRFFGFLLGPSYASIQPFLNPSGWLDFAEFLWRTGEQQEQSEAMLAGKFAARAGAFEDGFVGPVRSRRSAGVNPGLVRMFAAALAFAPKDVAVAGHIQPTFAGAQAASAGCASRIGGEGVDGFGRPFGHCSPLEDLTK